ncbi:MAG: hypothetical protein R3C68_02295 [Myxococcota bacterium]
MATLINDIEDVRFAMPLYCLPCWMPPEQVTQIQLEQRVMYPEIHGPFSIARRRMAT